YSKRDSIINYLKNNPHLIILDESTGYSDLELEFHLKSISYVHEIMQDILSKFTEAVKNYSYVYAKKVYKMSYMPEA
ncbi:MAG: hypothetical protein L0Y61_03770, partial [Epsilonproteobacteria bacterium]|nr:hypothetical protein [Campylobacterota bacterium]